jgi:hypothetical protein
VSRACVRTRASLTSRPLTRCAARQTKLWTRIPEQVYRDQPDPPSTHACVMERTMIELDLKNKSVVGALNEYVQLYEKFARETNLIRIFSGRFLPRQRLSVHLKRSSISHLHTTMATSDQEGFGWCSAANSFFVVFGILIKLAHLKPGSTATHPSVCAWYSSACLAVSCAVRCGMHAGLSVATARPHCSLARVTMCMCMRGCPVKCNCSCIVSGVLSRGRLSCLACLRRGKPSFGRSLETRCKIARFRRERATKEACAQPCSHLMIYGQSLVLIQSCSRFGVQ